jgi:hypothetical protein
MDEEEKPFGIVTIIILIIVALINDVAEVCFDLLSASAVGLVGEAIMEPANAILDLFFTGVFVWKTGFGGGTITQYIDDILQLTFIPGRTISVAIGIWIANRPKSVISVALTEGVALAEGNLKGAGDEVGQVGSGGGSSQGQNAPQIEDTSTGGGSTSTSTSNRPSVGGTRGAAASEDEEEDIDQSEPKKKDDLETIEEKNPMENLQKNLEGPQEEDFFKDTKLAEDKETKKDKERVRQTFKKVQDITERQKSGSPEEGGNEGKAA